MHKVCLQNKPNVTVKRLKNLSPIPRWVWSHFSNYQNSLQKHQLISEPSAIISNNSKISSKYQQFSTITVQYQKISEIICKKWHFKYVLEPVVKYTVKKVCLCLHSMTNVWAKNIQTSRNETNWFHFAIAHEVFFFALGFRIFFSTSNISIFEKRLIMLMV